MKYKILVVFITLLSFSLNSNASHSVGGELSYSNNGGNSYDVTYTFYRDCGGVPAPANIILNVSSSCFTGTLTLTQQGQAQILNTGCDSTLTACNGGYLPGIEKYTYSTTTNATPCSDYVISYQTCCRSASVANLLVPDNQSMGIITELDNLTSGSNNSPTFINDPVPFLCAGEKQTLDYSAIDADGDSLVYTLIDALKSPPNTTVNYYFPYSGLNPLPTDSGIFLDPQSGILEFIPNTVGSYAVAIRVDEYRSGTKIGSIMRDMQFVVTTSVCNIDSSNVSPYITNHFINLNNALMIDSGTLKTCGNVPVSFEVELFDPDTGDVIIGIPILTSGISAPSVTSVAGHPNRLKVSFTTLSSIGAISVLFSNNSCEGDVLDLVIDASSNSDDYTVSTKNTNCNGSVGSIDIIPGPSQSLPLSYQWASGDTTPSLNGLSSGWYVVTISGLCNKVEAIEIIDSCGSLSGIVFEDLNGNGFWDITESGISGIIAVIEDTSGHLYTDVSDINGEFEVIAEEYGLYSLGIYPPNYLDPCSNNSLGSFKTGSISFPPSSTYTFNVQPSSNISMNNDFGVQPPSLACGYINGNVFDDANNNGVKDNGEVGSINSLIEASNGESSLTDANGNYTLSVPLNQSVTISLSSVSFQYYCSSSAIQFAQTYPANNGTYIITLDSANTVDSGIDFGWHNTLNPNPDVGIFSLWTSTSSIHAGMNFNLWMDFKTSDSLVSPCTLRIDFDPLLTLLYGNLPVDTVGSDFAQIIFPSGTYIPWFCLNLVFYLDSTATSGYPLHFTAGWDCGEPDPCPANDSISNTFIVNSGPLKAMSTEALSMHSVDRNGPMDYVIDKQEVLSFIIDFMNTTGDEVYCFTIENPISEHLDLSTISFPFSSKPFDIFINTDNTVFFEFDNVYLPDSSADLFNSYGFIQYNILLKDDVPEGTIVENKAKLYWNNYNGEWTNSIFHEVRKSSGIIELDNNDVLIYPNPTSDLTTIKSKSRIETVEVYSAIGQKVLEISGNSTDVIVNLPATGVYFIVVTNEDGVFEQRVFKM